MEDNRKTLIANMAGAEEPEKSREAEVPAEELEVVENADEPKDSKATIIVNNDGAASELNDGEKYSDEGSAEFGLPEDHHAIGELRERIENRKKEKTKKQRRFRTWVYVTAVAFMVIIFGFFFSISGFFTVDSIEVEGNEHYTSEEIINIAHAVPGRNLIYNTNKSEMISYLEQNPYIKSANIKRKLPSTILISVDERIERMAFKYDDDYLVMDGEGVLLKKTRNQPQTTLVEGLIVNKIKLGEKIGTEDREKTNRAIDLIDSMTKSDLYFVKLDVSDMKKVKAYIYNNLVVKADYDTLVDNMENGHLHLVAESLINDGIKRGTVTFEEDGSASFMPII